MAIGTAASLAIGGIGSALIGSRGASRAADASAQASDAANATQRYIFDRSVGLTEPQRQAGQNALAALSAEYGLRGTPSFSDSGREMRIRNDNGNFIIQHRYGNNWRDTAQSYDNARDARLFMADNEFQGFKASPGYQFRQEEGQNALAAMAAARGMRLSGATLKDAARFGDGLASQEYGNYTNRLSGLAGLGQTANQQQISAGQNFANAFGANTINAGNARASAYQQQAQALQGGLNNAFMAYGLQQGGFFG